MKISHTVFKLPNGHEYMTQITIYTVQRAITPNVGKLWLWFLCSACHLMVVNIFVKFENISKQFSSYRADKIL